MRARQPLRHAATLAAVPLALLLGLVGGGALAWPPALAAAVLLAANALVQAQAWRRDLVQATQATGRAIQAAEAREAQAAATAAAEQALIHRLPDPLIILGPARAIHRTNAAAQAAFGSAFSAVLRHPGLRGAIDRALAEGRPQSVDVALPVPLSRDLSATILPLDPPLAGGGGIALFLTDRTRERVVERMRADFVANASHELRTPLTSLIGFIDTLRGPAADDPVAQSRFLAIMAEQAQRMNRLIDDLLSLSRIELTEHRSPEDPVDLVPLVRRLAEMLEPQSRARHVAILVDCPALPLIQGDEDQLEQVLQNLLDNAVKYGRDGGTVRLTAREAPPAPPWTARSGIAVAVADDGPGIPRAHIPRLTERFYRADKHRSRAVGGTGLGLAIVKHIVNRHRGQLTIDSTEGLGTTVTVWLPLPRPGQPPNAPAAGNAAAATP